MSRIFLIDSENVGDNWTLLLDASDMEDELFVFYTQKSPHMSYKNLIRLKNSPKDVEFIECYEGNNALDFQLVTELGYRLACDNGENEFFIVSNDNGFEAVVRYWRRKGMPVRRFTGKACASLSNLIKEASETTPIPSKENEENTPSTDNIATATETTVNVSEPSTAVEEAIIEPEETISEIQSASTEAPAAQAVSTDSPIVQDDSTNAPAEVLITEAVSIEAPSAEASENASPAPLQENAPQEIIANDASVKDTQHLTNEEKVKPAKESKAPAKKKESVSKKKNRKTPKSTETVEENVIEAAISNAAAEIESITVDEMSLQAFYLVGKENLANLHEALMQLYGNDKCKKLYNIFKTDASYNKIPTEYKNMSPQEKQNGYCKIAFQVQGSNLPVPDDFSEVILKAWRGKKNLNSLRAKLIGKYSKESGLQYYNLIKAHMKVLDNIS